MNGDRNFVFFSTACLPPRWLTICGLWFSGWSSPAFQQLSGITQTCATKSLGTVGQREGAPRRGKASEDYHAHGLGKIPGLGPALRCGLCRDAWSKGSLCLFESGSSSGLGVPSPLSLLFPTWGDSFSFSLGMVTLSLATGKTNSK